MAETGEKMPEPKTEVMANSQGEGRGVLVPVAASQLREIGLDPDQPIRARRYIFDTDRGSVLFRMENVEEDDDD